MCNGDREASSVARSLLHYFNILPHLIPPFLLTDPGRIHQPDQNHKRSLFLRLRFITGFSPAIDAAADTVAVPDVSGLLFKTVFRLIFHILFGSFFLKFSQRFTKMNLHTKGDGVYLTRQAPMCRSCYSFSRVFSITQQSTNMPNSNGFAIDRNVPETLSQLMGSLRNSILKP